MNRKIYATDGEYTLCPITKEDIKYYCQDAYKEMIKWARKQ